MQPIDEQPAATTEGGMMDDKTALDNIAAMLDGDDRFPSRQGFEEIRNLLRLTGRFVGSPGPEPVDPEPSGV